jgi:thermitase
MNSGESLPTHPLIKSAKNLFNNYYVIFSDDIETLKKDLTQNKKINYINYDFKSDRSTLPQATPAFIGVQEKGDKTFNDPYINNQWSLRNLENNGMSVIRTYANRRSSPRQEVIVAVVDTGVDYNHEDLPMWINQNEIPSNGIDDDGNGYVDDIHGINTLIRDSNGNATVDVMDAHNHGTHVSGSIAAIQNNNKGIAGVASNAKIMAIRTVPNSSDETDVDVTEAFIYAAKNGAKIINCSFGKGRNERGMMVRDAINHIGETYGVLVVAASGNSMRNIDMYPTYPASFDSENLLVVASTSSGGGFSYFTNYGIEGVDIAGPGSSILSTIIRNRYTNMSGTSMASPNVAGVAAEVFANYPDLRPEELKEILMESSHQTPVYATKIKSGGRADLERALELASQY